MNKLSDDHQDPAKGQFLVFQAKEGELEPSRPIKKLLTARQESRLV